MKHRSFPTTREQRRVVVFAQPAGTTPRYLQKKNRALKSEQASYCQLSVARTFLSETGTVSSRSAWALLLRITKATSMGVSSPSRSKKPLVKAADVTWHLTGAQNKRASGRLTGSVQYSGHGERFCGQRCARRRHEGLKARDTTKTTTDKVYPVAYPLVSSRPADKRQRRQESENGIYEAREKLRLPVGSRRRRVSVISNRTTCEALLEAAEGLW